MSVQSNWKEKLPVFSACFWKLLKQSQSSNSRGGIIDPTVNRRNGRIWEVYFKIASQEPFFIPCYHKKFHFVSLLQLTTREGLTTVLGGLGTVSILNRKE
jgi:hypothetical protein